jgi:hypothetical protein
MLGYFLGWQPSEIDKMDYYTLVKCMEVVQALVDEGVRKSNLELLKGKVKLL